MSDSIASCEQIVGSRCELKGSHPCISLEPCSVSGLIICSDKDTLKLKLITFPEDFRSANPSLFFPPLCFFRHLLFLGMFPQIRRKKAEGYRPRSPPHRSKKSTSRSWGARNPGRVTSHLWLPRDKISMNRHRDCLSNSRLAPSVEVLNRWWVCGPISCKTLDANSLAYSISCYSCPIICTVNLRRNSCLCQRVFITPNFCIWMTPPSMSCKSQLCHDFLPSSPRNCWALLQLFAS